jgi:hypothetical protein
MLRISFIKGHQKTTIKINLFIVILQICLNMYHKNLAKIKYYLKSIFLNDHVEICGLSVQKYFAIFVSSYSRV